jgi:hypothetical protein
MSSHGEIPTDFKAALSRLKVSWLFRSQYQISELTDSRLIIQACPQTILMWRRPTA